MQDALGRRALEAALAVAGAHGLRTDAVEVLADRANLVVRLGPVVARVATTTAFARGEAAAQHLARELAVARYLAARGAPVVTPADDVLPAGPHVHEGLPLTFWTHLAGGPAGPGAVDAARLAELHAALAGYAGPPALPVLGPLAEVPAFVRKAGVEVDRLLAMHQRLDAQLSQATGSFRPLHGDAHGKNLLRAADGRLLWTDFEDTCLGPLEWDAVCAGLSAGDPATLQLCREARTLQGVAWLQVLAQRYPADAPRAQAALRSLTSSGA